MVSFSKFVSLQICPYLQAMTTIELEPEIDFLKWEEGRFPMGGIYARGRLTAGFIISNMQLYFYFLFFFFTSFYILSLVLSFV